MLKHQADASFELLAKRIGPTTTSLAQKKARLIFAKPEREPSPCPSPIEVAVDSFEHPMRNLSNLFSRERLDIGTRFFLDHIPVGPFRDILDLGCGNGILGIAAKRRNPTARVQFSDDSRMAIESARENYQAFFPDRPDDARFHWTHCFEDGEPNSLDLVLCNPPFHQGTTVDDSVAWRMFKDAHRALRPGGTLRVIGNSSLRHSDRLKKVFGNCHTVATNAKFTITDSIKI
jgi:16S rRNA G1207 methylase RsmC